MALTGTDRGTGATNTGGQNTVVVVPASNCTAGALLVLCVGYDNSGTNGADPFSAISDTKGNTWTSRQASLNDPGAANAGFTLRIFTCPQDVGTLTTSDTVTIALGGITTVVRVWTLQEIVSSLGKPFYITGGQETDSTASPSIVSGTIKDGHVIVAAVAREDGASTQTEDSDTTNGSWSTAQLATRGVAGSGGQIISQRKIVNAAGAQTYNPTFSSSADDCEAWIEIGENIILAPAPATIVFAGVAPGIAITPTARLTMARPCRPFDLLGAGISSAMPALVL